MGLTLIRHHSNGSNWFELSIQNTCIIRVYTGLLLSQVLDFFNKKFSTPETEMLKSSKTGVDFCIPGGSACHSQPHPGVSFYKVVGVRQWF